MARMFDIREPSLAALAEAPVYFRYGANRRRILVDKLTANALLACHEALREDLRPKFERMISGSPEQLRRVVDFCWKHVRIGGAA